jgi:hypothetical protein
MPARPELRRLPLAVVALTLAGLVLSSAVGIEPVWLAAGGGARLSHLRRARGDRSRGHRQRPGHRGVRCCPLVIAARSARDCRA